MDLRRTSPSDHRQDVDVKLQCAPNEQIKELEWGIGDNIVAEAVFARQKKGFIKVSISSVNKIAGKGGVAGGTCGLFETDSPIARYPSG